MKQDTPIGSVIIDTKRNTRLENYPAKSNQQNGAYRTKKRWKTSQGRLRHLKFNVRFSYSTEDRR